jgi:uncharacterized oligopeptide transporter (OPT) family protein
MALSAVLFASISGFKTYCVRRGIWWAKWVPSGIAFAIGFLNTPSFSLARLIGGITEYVYRRRMGQHGIGLIIVASGFVLGEGVVSVISLVLKTFGVGVASCIGCGAGVCAGCPGGT